VFYIPKQAWPAHPRLTAGQPRASRNAPKGHQTPTSMFL
jgi:hypothetical protein